MSPGSTSTLFLVVFIALYATRCLGFNSDADEVAAAQASETLTVDSSNSVWGNSLQHKEPSSSNLKLRALLCPGCSASRSGSAFPTMKSSSNEFKRGFWDKRSGNDRRILFRLIDDAPQGK